MIRSLSHSRCILIVFLFISISAAFPVPPCTLTFCALNGPRAMCAPPDPSCLPPQPLETCNFHAPAPCADWPGLNCHSICPTVCLPLEHRPVASDGVAYCSDCSFTHASCLSKFSIVGPVARGTHNARSVEPKPSPTLQPNSTSLSDVNQIITVSPSPSISPSVLPSKTPVSVADNVFALPSLTSVPIYSPSSSPVHVIDCTNIDKLSTNDHITCCKTQAIGCLKEGDVCISKSSYSLILYLDTGSGQIPCEKDTYCLPSTGKCTKNVPACTVDWCSRHGKNFICAWEESGQERIGSCAHWALSGYVDCEKDAACDFKCDESSTDSYMASDGGKYCSTCALSVESCKRGFQFYGPTDVV